MGRASLPADGGRGLMRVMALDPGSRRVGVAVSDELGLIATPVAIIERTTRARDLERLRALIDEFRPTLLLVGLPGLPSGELGAQARQSERYAEHLSQAIGLPVQLWNESYSTIEAGRRRAGASARRKSRAIDAEAAAVFLQDFLDSQR